MRNTASGSSGSDFEGSGGRDHTHRIGDGAIGKEHAERLQKGFGERRPDAGDPFKKGQPAGRPMPPGIPPPLRASAPASTFREPTAETADPRILGGRDRPDREFPQRQSRQRLGHSFPMLIKRSASVRCGECAMLDDSLLLDRFEGCLLGLALGDALGGRFEAMSAESLESRFPSVEALMAYPQDELWYTDDTQMAIGVAEALIERGEIEEESLCRAFAANYLPSRGYGRGTRAVLDAMEEGRDYRSVAETYFPGGSYGNGAAMRVASVGLFYGDDRKSLWEQARLSALPTHTHTLGIEGARLLALAVAIALAEDAIASDRFLESLLSACQTQGFREKLQQVRTVRTPEDLIQLGNRIEAVHSVPTAIASFLLSPDSYEETIGRVILLGGDTDTLAAMAGALAGTTSERSDCPRGSSGCWNRAAKGRDYIRTLAGRLFHACRRRLNKRPAAVCSPAT